MGRTLRALRILRARGAGPEFDDGLPFRPTMANSEAMNEKGRVVLVTGGGQGIGRGTAELLAERGWSVHVNVRDDAKRAEAAEVFGDGHVHGGDLVEAGVAHALADRITEAEGRLDAVVHAIGPYTTNALSEESVDSFRTMWDGNVLTALRMIDAGREAVRRVRGSWVFFGCAGLERWRSRSVTPAYISAKAALLVAVRSLALEEARHGVRANMISPGFVPHDGAAPDTNAEGMHDRIPIGRPAEMREAAGACAWLLSDEAGHVVGQNLEVAGGWML